MKRIPTDEMEVIITANNRVVKRCALGQQEEPLFGYRTPEEYIAACAAEPDREFAFVEGDGTLIRVAQVSPAEAAFSNLLLEYFGSDRRWIEV